MPLILALSMLVTCFFAIVAPSSAALRLGFTDQAALGLTREEDLATVMGNARRAGADVWRIGASWATIAPAAPPTADDARNPGWSGYRFSSLDRAVRAAAAAGMAPVPFVTTAPRWAEGPRRPTDLTRFPAGTWRPSARAFGRFATALARRYSGDFPDPADPARPLPRIATWQAWNEPNLSVEITPQWVRKKGKWTVASAGIYRALVNEFSLAVKAVDPKLKVLSAGTAPYGDLRAGDARMPPVRFWRELLCVSGRSGPKARRCPVVRLDAIAHHPYPIGPPRRKARNPDDATVPDLGKITRVVAAADKRRTIRPVKRNRELWATEISWDSAPDPGGLSLAEHATYLEASLYVLARQGVDVVTWFNLRDNAPRPSYAASYQSGIFLRGATPQADRPKPAYTAFRFPFTAYRNSGIARLWGKAPESGPVTVQAQVNGTWRTVLTLKARRDRMFTGRLRLGPRTRLRALSDSEISLTWVTQ